MEKQRLDWFYESGKTDNFSPADVDTLHSSVRLSLSPEELGSATVQAGTFYTF